MSFKKVLLPLLALSLILSGCKKKTDQLPEAPAKKQIINALPINERPCVALFPHSTNKLITLFLDKPTNTPELTIDLEYLSGNSLKGGRTTVNFPVSLPYTQAFLLGSCSSGGKCSFDKDITTGTIKTKLEQDTEIHILKSNYVFVNGASATTDQKLKFTPKSKSQLILGYSHGYLDEVDGEAASEPFVITSSSATTVTGTLTFISPDATKVVYYDGNSYKDLKATKTDSTFTADINLKPWSKDVTITRDDLKGQQEDLTLYFIGPFIPLK